MIFGGILDDFWNIFCFIQRAAIGQERRQFCNFLNDKSRVKRIYIYIYPPPRFCAQGVLNGSVVLWAVVLVSVKLVN